MRQDQTLEPQSGDRSQVSVQSTLTSKEKFNATLTKLQRVYYQLSLDAIAYPRKMKRRIAKGQIV